MDGSYKLESFTDNAESEVNRLKYQVDLFYRKELELYKKVGLRDGMKIIECGSGPGFLISNIILDLPDCSATAVELDPLFVEQLNKVSTKNGLKLFEVKHASIYDTQLPENYFDFAIARLVLEHLSEPQKAIAEVRRILKPGGIFVIVSNDFDYHLLTYPAIPELDEMYSAYIKSRINECGNPLIGRQLPALMKNGNFEAINLEVICVHSELEGDKAFLKAENVNISKSLVKEGFLKEEILESLIENWYKMLHFPNHAIYRQLFVISGVKSLKTENKSKVISEKDKIKSTTQKMDPDALKGMDSKFQESALSEYFLDTVRTVMEQQDLDINLDAKLYDIDIDSIAAAELSSIVKTDYSISISISDILQRLSIKDIIRVILNEINSVRDVLSNEVGSKQEDKWLEGEL